MDVNLFNGTTQSLIISLTGLSSLSIALGKPNGIVTSLASDFETAANCKVVSMQYNHLFY